MTPEQTLDWLAEQHKSQCNEDRPVQEWIRSMKSMLPAPVQSAERVEPVAWCVLEPWLSGKFEAQDCFSDVALDANVGWVPLYTTLPAAQRQPLTDEQIKQIYTEQTGSFIDDSPWALLDFARAIEAAHGIKEKNSD